MQNPALFVGGCYCSEHSRREPRIDGVRVHDVSTIHVAGSSRLADAPLLASAFAHKLFERSVRVVTSVGQNRAMRHGIAGIYGTSGSLDPASY